jgi:hypothetical protein
MPGAISDAGGVDWNATSGEDLQRAGREDYPKQAFRRLESGKRTSKALTKCWFATCSNPGRLSRNTPRRKSSPRVKGSWPARESRGLRKLGPSFQLSRSAIFDLFSTAVTDLVLSLLGGDASL